MLEAALRERWYKNHDPSAIGTDGWVPEQLCKELPVQAPVALINGGDLQFGALSGESSELCTSTASDAHPLTRTALLLAVPFT